MFRNFSLFHSRVNVGNFSEMFSGNSSVSPLIDLNSNFLDMVPIENGFQSAWHLNIFNFSFIHFSRFSRSLTSCSFVKLIQASDNFFTVG
jgi:hypothetical protein